MYERAGHARHLPEANLQVTHSQLAALSHNRETRTIVQKVAMRAANIQLDSSSLLLSFMPTP